MDLRALEQPPADEERAAVDAVLGVEDAHATVPLADAKARRTKLLPALLAVQARVGWLSPGALGYACRRLSVPPAEGFGVASFYALISLEPKPRAFAHVCDDLACQLAGARHVDGKDRGATPCLGLCEQAPAAYVTVAGKNPVEQGFGAATTVRVERALRGEVLPVPPPPLPVRDAHEKLVVRIGKYEPTSLEGYRSVGGYEALTHALTLGPKGVAQALTQAKLVGRGGAAFPTGRKWEAVANAKGSPKYVVCNADESEPGTFKDRVLLEGDPFAVIEAMTIAGFATGATKGFLYVRGEYALAAQRLEAAIAAARQAGLLGDDVLGKGFAFDLELRRGGGAYICGEETALFASIEGLRGEPRNKPPFPVNHGLFGKPTAINNVETLVAAVAILREGVDGWTRLGTAQSPGTKLFCVSGRVAKPGVYEVPFGTTLEALLERCGGVTGKLHTVLLGGAAGSFVPADKVKLELSFEAARAAGFTLGSGVVFVLREGDSLLPLLRRLAEFFRDESCGQCVPCRVGTVRQEELLARLLRNAPLGSLDDELKLMKELGQAMRDASICGLGQTASTAIESAFALFPPSTWSAP
ncbi:MAG: NADH-ubiquinone oxidoreductase-F iron-sulfur binding region domain-containing protein [Myxococcaceae bacterium]